jgi:predicted enzyme related to lactoylglutathione lyase
MAEDIKPEVGTITWFDLTVENAEEVKDFYSKVVGWKSDPLKMGDYNDYNMNKPGDNQTVTGICHAKGGNSNLPPQWLMYITVENVNDSAKKCVELGGKIISDPKDMQGYGSYCVIQDPAGAVCALFEPQ